MTQADAERMITGYGFKVGAITEKESEEVAAGLIIEQDKPVGEMMDLDTAIALVVSKGFTKEPAEVKVPDLSGMTQTEAEAALFNVKLVPVPLDPTPQNGVTPGKVFQQSIEANTTVKEGTQVSFTAALGSTTIKVPQVYGLWQDTAKRH